MTRLRTFGGLTVEGAGQGLGGAAGQRRPLALLLLLAAAGDRGVSRDKVLGLLWPDSDAEHARSVLRQTLYALRRDLALPELFHGTADLRLNAALLPSDLAAFDAAVAAGDRERVVALYEGPLADGFFLTKAPEFERWLETERRTRAQQFAAAAVSSASEASRQGDHARAVAFWRRAATADRLSARVAVQLMRALADAGDRVGAIQHARVYDSIIRAELDAAPDPEVAALAEQLRSATVPPEMTVGQGRSRNGTHRDADAGEISRVFAVAGETAADPSSTPARWRSPLRAALIATSVGVVALAGFAVFTTRRWQSPPLDPTVIAIAPYEVLDPALALWREGLMDVLSHNLDGAGPLRTLAPSVALRHWSGSPHKASALKLARRTGAGIVVFGYLFRAGTDSVRVVASLYEAASHRIVAVERRDAAGRMDRLTDSLTLALLRELEGWLPIGAARRTPLGGSAPLEALKAFLRGEQFYRRTQWDSARTAYEHAIAHDSTFALPVWRLGEVLGWQRRVGDRSSQEYKLRAGALNHGLGPRDSMLVLADSLSAAANRVPTTLEEWLFVRRLFHVLDGALRAYPDDPEVWYALGEARYHHGFGPQVGVPESATLEAFDRAIALDSAFAPAYVHTAEVALTLGGAALGRRYMDVYLRRHPADPSGFIRLLRRLTAAGASNQADVARLLDTLPLELVSAARTATRRWPDSSGTALRLSRRLAAARGPGRYGPLPTEYYERVLASQLAFRGHVREAERVIGNRDEPITFELAYVSAAPTDAVAARLTRLVDARSADAPLALRWWSARRDTASLIAWLAMARERARSGDRVTRLIATYDTAAAQAHLALVRRDSAEALRRFVALPDTLCMRCYTDRLTRAELLSARGRYHEALACLRESLYGVESPFEVLFALERGKVAERLGDRPAATRAYQLVLDAWTRGDPDVARYVSEARRGMARLTVRR